ncbi:hypothetical protein ACWGI8_44300, partial [Streptomyces sp. NPDC054841]
LGKSAFSIAFKALGRQPERTVAVQAYDFARWLTGFTTWDKKLPLQILHMQESGFRRTLTFNQVHVTQQGQALARYQSVSVTLPTSGYRQRWNAELGDFSLSTLVERRNLDNQVIRQTEYGQWTQQLPEPGFTGPRFVSDPVGIIQPLDRPSRYRWASGISTRRPEDLRDESVYAVLLSPALREAGVFGVAVELVGPQPSADPEAVWAWYVPEQGRGLATSTELAQWIADNGLRQGEEVMILHQGLSVSARQLLNAELRKATDKLVDLGFRTTVYTPHAGYRFTASKPTLIPNAAPVDEKALLAASTVTDLPASSGGASSTLSTIPASRWLVTSHESARHPRLRDHNGLLWIQERPMLTTGPGALISLNPSVDQPDWHAMADWRTGLLVVLPVLSTGELAVHVLAGQRALTDEQLWQHILKTGKTEPGTVVAFAVDARLDEAAYALLEQQIDRVTMPHGLLGYLPRRGELARVRM